MAVAVQVTQLSNGSAEVTWTDDGTPAAHELFRDVGAGESRVAWLDDPDVGSFIDLDPGAAVGDSYTARVRNVTDAVDGSATITWRDLDEPFTYGKVDRLAGPNRYTDEAKVTAAMGISNPDPQQQARIRDAIAAAEIAIDVHCSRSFPDTGTNPQWPGVPKDVVIAATGIAVAVYKALDAPFGTAGSDELIGSLDVSDTLRRELAGHPLLRGYQVEGGFS